MPTRRRMRSARCAESGSGMRTAGLPRKPSTRPRFATAATLPFSRAARSAAVASCREMPSNCASAAVIAVPRSAAKMSVLMRGRIIAVAATRARKSSALGRRAGRAVPNERRDALADAGLVSLLVRMVGRAHERADGRVPEAELRGVLFEPAEDRRLDIALDRQVMRRRLQILANG